MVLWRAFSIKLFIHICDGGRIFFSRHLFYFFDFYGYIFRLRVLLNNDNNKEILRRVFFLSSSLFFLRGMKQFHIMGRRKAADIFTGTFSVCIIHFLSGLIHLSFFLKALYYLCLRKSLSHVILSSAPEVLKRFSEIMESFEGTTVPLTLDDNVRNDDGPPYCYSSVPSNYSSSSSFIRNHHVLQMWLHSISSYEVAFQPRKLAHF